MPDQTAQAPVSPLGAEADRIRETSKWLIASFAALGSVLVAGSQLSSLGSLSVGSFRFGIALLGVVLALAAVVVAISKVSNVLVLEPLSLQTLSGDPQHATLRSKLQADTSLVPSGDLTELYSTYRAAQDSQRETFERLQAHLRSSPGTPLDPGMPSGDDLLRLAQAADSWAQDQSARVQNVVAVARLLRVSNAFIRAKPWILAMTILAALGIVGFAAAANPGAPARVVAVARDSAVTVRLTHLGRSTLAPGLGARCRTTTIPAIVLDITGDSFDVVTIPSGDCRALRFVLSPALGSVK